MIILLLNFVRQTFPIRDVLDIGITQLLTPLWGGNFLLEICERQAYWSNIMHHRWALAVQDKLLWLTGACSHTPDPACLYKSLPRCLTSTGWMQQPLESGLYHLRTGISPYLYHAGNPHQLHAGISPYLRHAGYPYQRHAGYPYQCHAGHNSDWWIRLEYWETTKP